MSVLSHHAVKIRFDHSPLVTEAFGAWCFDHLDVQWAAGEERVRSAILEIVSDRLEKKSEVEDFLSSALLGSILQYLKSSSSLYLSESCAVLRKAAVKETSRHRLIVRGLLEILNLPHLFESKHETVRHSVYELLRVLSEYSEGSVAVYAADYLLPAFNTLVSDERSSRNQTALMHLLANMVFNGSAEVSLFSDRFFNLENLFSGATVSPAPATAGTRNFLCAWLRLVTAVASRSDAGKRVTLACLPAVLSLVRSGHADREIRVLAFAFLATATVLKEARFAFHAQRGLHDLLAVFGASDEEEEVLRYAAQCVTALAEWPQARTELQALRPALERLRSRGHVFQRTADQLAWTP